MATSAFGKKLPLSKKLCAPQVRWCHFFLIMKFLLARYKMTARPQPNLLERRLQNTQCVFKFQSPSGVKMIRKTFLGFFFIVGNFAIAQTVSIQETISTQITGTTPDKFEQLKKQATNACNEWIKKSPFHLYSASIQSVSACSAPKFEKLNETKTSFECWTEVHPVTGQSIEYCGNQTKNVHVGYRGQAIGTRSIEISVPFDRSENDLTSESFVGPQAKTQAWSNYLSTCNNWLKEVSTKWGNKLLFAGCRGTEKDSLTYNGKEGIAYYNSTAVLLTER